MVFPESTSSKPNDYLSRLEVDVEDGSEFIDQWDTGELLFLASSVLRSDRNWISVSRSIKPFGEQTRPTDWYIPKNCAFQYTKLLSEIEDESKKKTLPRTERETSEVMLVKNLTEKRLSELAWLNQQTKSTANVLKSYMEMVENGDFDEHLDDLLNKMEDFDKNEEDNYNQYVSKRGNLMHAKKLNTSKIVKGKAVTKAVDPKKKLPIFPDQSDDSFRQSPMKEAHIKKEPITDDDNTKAAPSKSETITQLTLNALLDTKVTTASESPLLTSLLRSISSPSTSQTPLSAVCSPSKESDILDDFSKSDLEKSREASPRGSVPPSPRSSTASSPMLNSLLKNSPSSTTSIQLSPVKETSPKVSSSPQSFFNPTSNLATAAAAQQLSVATPTISSSHQFFQQHDLSDGSRKVTIRTSPVTSACLAAPTLSKLLEMPPSSPGRLPPLPILDPPVTPITSIIPPIAPEPTSKPPTPLDAKQPVFESPSKKASSLASVEASFFPDSTVLLKSSTSYSMADRRSISSEEAKPSAFIEKIFPKVDDLQKDSNVILEEISEVFNQSFVEVEIKKEIVDDDEEDETSKAILDTIEATESTAILSPSAIKLEPVNPLHVEEMEISDCILNESLTFEDIIQQKIPSISNISPTIETISCSASSSLEPTILKHFDILDDDKGASGRKFYKSRLAAKKEEPLEKIVSEAPILSSPKKLNTVKLEIESLSPTIASETISTSVDVVATDPVSEKLQEIKPAKSTESRSPVSKKPRLYERSSTEKLELSEDDMTTAVRRSGRRGKKGRGRVPKSTPIKQPDPKDQYEFSESTEENSVGYQATNTLCYMPRSKEETRSDDLKIKSAQDSEDAPSNASSPTEKKFSTPTRNKQGKTPQAVAARKSLFTSDEERMSDSVTSDEASNHLLSEDKLKKWEETCEKKGDIAKTANESLRRISKAIESPKKKSIAGKRSSVGKGAPPGKKERKLSSLDMEDLSAGSRDSEELSLTQEKENSEEKVIVPPISLDMEVETNDSQPSSSNAAESDNKMEDNDESLQGSVTTDFSPPATAEIKDEKDPTHFGKQDWFQGVSPKSSEAVSQSSEESEEYESDNWDNQSVSTNKSASQSTGMQPRLKRKERETPEYKAWKKAISIVLREASCHKNANVFLQKVTNDVAPGYLNIVHRPMDLSLIKKNIDNGIVRTTEEFHRDMLIMFQNAIMYNSSDHDVHQMAVEMQQDVLEQISAFVLTQSNGKDEVSEPVSSLRGTRKSQKGKQTASSTKGKEDADKE